MVEQTSELVERLQTITDPRRQCANLKHQLVDILILGFCGVLADCDDFVQIAAWAKLHEEFFRTFLELPNGIPSHDTFTRVFSTIQPLALQKILLPWLHQRCGLPGELIHLDGKTLRGSRCRAKELGALHVVSAWAGQNGLTLGQVAVDAKSNEITALPQLIALLDLRDKVVTIDAMGCQKEIAAAIVEKGGDYVLAVKENQPTLHAEVQAAFVEAQAQDPVRSRIPVTTQKGHGREERRTVHVLKATGRLSQSEAWLGVLSLVMVVREVTCPSTGTMTKEARYFISSLKPNARKVGQAIRSHWSIENGLHWVLDVVFREDARKLYDRTAAENVSFLGRLAISLLRKDTSKGSLRVKRKRAGWDIRFVAQLLGFHSN